MAIWWYQLHNPFNYLSSTSITQSPPPRVIPAFDPSRKPRSLAKSYEILHVSLDNYFRLHPVASTLFVTLTFAKDVRCPKEAYRRLNSLNNDVRKRYTGHFWVLHLHQSGRLHYHLIIPAGFDCHNGTCLEDWYPKNNRSPAQKRASMNPRLRVESYWWQTTARSHGFGIVEVAPIYSNAEAIRNYLLTRPTDSQLSALPPRTRFWGCRKHLKIGTTNFGWVSPGAKMGRQRMAAWAANYGCSSMEEIREHLGPHWGYFYKCDQEHARRVANSSAHFTPSTSPLADPAGRSRWQIPLADPAVCSSSTSLRCH